MIKKKIAILILILNFSCARTANYQATLESVSSQNQSEILVSQTSFEDEYIPIQNRTLIVD